MTKIRFLTPVLPVFVFSLSAFAGPFPPSAGQVGSDAVSAQDPRLMIWASEADLERGFAEIARPDKGVANYGDPIDALGPADAHTLDDEGPLPVVSLGDGGRATLTMSAPFGDIPGPDFAVFENGFATIFLELAHVEVSSDGINFFRFPSVSLTMPSTTVGEGGTVDSTNVRNLAGKYVAGFGAPFDLAELGSVSPDLDIQRITHVRVIDVVGTNDPAYASLDADGRIIIDPYPTVFGSGGFDLDAVGAFSPTSLTYAAWLTAQGLSGPSASPTADFDQDGVPNLIAYLTGARPLTVVKVAEGLELKWSYLAYRGGANLRLESSQDLLHWNSLAESQDGAAFFSVSNLPMVEAGEALKTVRLSLPVGTQPMFYRLSAELTNLP